MFSLTFNTSFEEMTGHRMILYKRDLEGACDDNDNKKFYANFKLELFFITQEKMREVRKRQRELGEFGDDLPLMDDGINDDEISYSESGKEKKEKMRAEVGRAICSACRNHIFDEESSISLGPRELVHWACLRCGKCSQLLASLGGSGQCVVQGGRVVCDACQEGFWPKCQECHLPVTQQNVVSFGDLVWHPQCAGCQSCKTLQTDHTRPEFHVKKKQIYCHHCAVMSPLTDDRIEDYTLTPRQEELLFTIQDGTAARHFDEYLRRTHADENVEFWRDVERYKVLPSAELRTRKAEEIASKYLSPKCIKPINVDATARDKVLTRVNSGDRELFDEAQHAVFNLLEHDAYSKYISSPEYQRYLDGTFIYGRYVTLVIDVRFVQPFVRSQTPTVKLKCTLLKLLRHSSTKTSCSGALTPRSLSAASRHHVPHHVRHCARFPNQCQWNPSQCLKLKLLRLPSPSQ